MIENERFTKYEDMIQRSLFFEMMEEAEATKETKLRMRCSGKKLKPSSLMSEKLCIIATENDE